MLKSSKIETPADAVAEIAFQSGAAKATWGRIRQLFANVQLPDTEISASIPGVDLKMKLRANVYDNEMLGVRGQMDMAHYEERLRMVLDDEAYRVALEMLTEAAVTGGRLSGDAIARQHALQAAEANPVPIEDVLHVLEHDGYLARQEDGYCFLSGLLEDWWRVRYGRSRASSASPSVELARSAQR